MGTVSLLSRLSRVASPGRAFALALCTVAAASHAARADRPRDTPAAIEVDRDATPAGRIGFGFDGGEPVDAWGVSVAASLVARPIELAPGAFGGGSPPTRPVRRRETVTVGGALAVGDRVVLDGALRVSHQVGDRLRAAGNPDPLARYVVHDVRLGGRIRVAGDRDRAALLRADLTLPSGNAEQFAGDASWTAAWRLIGRITLPYQVVLAGGAGIRLHGAEVAIGDRLIGDELFAAVGVAVPLTAVGLGGIAEHVALTGELAGALGDHVGMQAAPSPLEARLGLTVQPVPALAIGARIGVGLDEQIGAPSFRALIELAWTPRRARPAAPAISPPDPDDELDDAD
jgi:hypothetical protein